MTNIGIIHLVSAIYLSGVFCLAVSLFENRDPRRIARETLRRWAKLLGVALVIAIVVSIIG